MALSPPAHLCSRLEEAWGILPNRSYVNAFDEHIEKLAGLESSLAKELGTHPASKLKSYSSVA